MCLCGSQIDYSACCQPFHDYTEVPLTAEYLMRSRFTAYAKQNVDYLLKTWDNSKRPKEIDFSKEEVEWTRLEIVSTKKGGEKDSKGLVEFKAFYMQDDEEYVMKEMSRFIKTAGQWKYLDGLVNSVAKAGQDKKQTKEETRLVHVAVVKNLNAVVVNKHANYFKENTRENKKKGY